MGAKRVIEAEIPTDNDIKMKIGNKIIEDVINTSIGEDALPIVTSLKNKKNVSEFKIAEMAKMPINETRNALYRLYHANLVSFIRKKDKKKGWYIYYWTFNPKRIKYLQSETKKNRLERLKERLEREKGNTFFSCEGQCIRLNFEQAMDFTYKCPECGGLMHQEDNSEKIKEVEEDIKKLTKEIKDSKK